MSERCVTINFLNKDNKNYIFMQYIFFLLYFSNVFKEFYDLSFLLYYFL